MHCIVSSLKWASKMSTLPINGKISMNAYAYVVYVYNVTSSLYCAINNHFCVIRVPFVATSRLACRWMCDSPRTGCAWRHAPTYMWHEQAKTKAHIYIMHMNLLGTNYCISKRWPMGPLQQSLPPPGSNLYLLRCDQGPIVRQGGSACVKKRAYVTASSHLSRVCDAFSHAARMFLAIFLFKLYSVTVMAKLCTNSLTSMTHYYS